MIDTDSINVCRQNNLAINSKGQVTTLYPFFSVTIKSWVLCPVEQGTLRAWAYPEGGQGVRTSLFPLKNHTWLYVSLEILVRIKVRKRAKIRNRYNQAPHLIQDTKGKVTTSQLDITNESQEVSPFPAGDHKASTNRRAW